MRIIFVAIVVAIGASLPARAAEPQVDFVREVVRELASIEQLRASSLAELSAPNADQMAACLHSTTAFQIELGAYPAALRRFHLSGELATFPELLASSWEQEVLYYERMSAICQQMEAAALGSPQPGVNYGTLAAEMPRVRAFVEATEKNIFTMTPALAIALMDMQPNAQGKIDRLLLTATERENLIEQLGRDFPKIDDPQPNYFNSMASVLRKFLQDRSRKSADDA